MAIEEAKDAKQKKVTIDDEDYKIKKLERIEEEGDMEYCLKIRDKELFKTIKGMRK